MGGVMTHGAGLFEADGCKFKSGRKKEDLLGLNEPDSRLCCCVKLNESHFSTHCASIISGVILFLDKI